MVVKFVAILAFLAVASASGLKFSYGVASPFSGELKRNEVIGQYSLLGPYATTRTLDYSVGGLNAIVRKDPAWITYPAAYSYSPYAINYGKYGAIGYGASYPYAGIW